MQVWTNFQSPFDSGMNESLRKKDKKLGCEVVIVGTRECFISFLLSAGDSVNAWKRNWIDMMISSVI